MDDSATSLPDMAREAVVDAGVHAVLAYEEWHATKKGLSSACKPVGRLTMYKGPTAEDVVMAFTDDLREQCALLSEINDRVKEGRDA